MQKLLECGKEGMQKLARVWKGRNAKASLSVERRTE